MSCQFGKALAQADWVKRVLDKVRTEEIAAAWRQAFSPLDMPVPLDLASAGVVLAVGAAVRQISSRLAASNS